MLRLFGTHGEGQSIFLGCALPLAVLATGLYYAVPVVAQDDDGSDDRSESCLSMNLVRSARAIDDDTILFQLRDGRTYLNSLDQNCPGLRLNNRFSYNLRTGARIPRLCHTDTISVIERSGDGFTCELGRFQPISAAAAEELLRAPHEPDPEVTVIDIEPSEGPTEQEEQSDPGQSP